MDQSFLPSLVDQDTVSIPDLIVAVFTSVYCTADITAESILYNLSRFSVKFVFIFVSRQYFRTPNSLLAQEKTARTVALQEILYRIGQVCERPEARPVCGVIVQNLAKRCYQQSAA